MVNTHKYIHIHTLKRSFVCVHVRLFVKVCKKQQIGIMNREKDHHQR